MRFLLEIADAGALGDPGLAVILLVEAGHDLEQRRLARAVDAEHADLGVRVERQMNVIEHLPGRIALGQALHEIDELARHRSRETFDLRKFACRRCNDPALKGQCFPSVHHGSIRNGHHPAADPDN
jgi:hypothetical protein